MISQCILMYVSAISGSIAAAAAAAAAAVAAVALRPGYTREHDI